MSQITKMTALDSGKYQTPLWRAKAIPDAVKQAVAGGWFPSGSSVLTVGCGHGGIAAWLASWGYKVSGIDRNQSAIDRARAKYATVGIGLSGGKLEYRIVDLCRELPALGPFDALLDCGYFHGLEQACQFRYACNLGLSSAPGARFLLLCPWPHCIKRSDVRVMRGDARVFLAHIQTAFAPVFEIFRMEETVLPGNQHGDPSSPGIAFWMRRR